MTIKTFETQLLGWAKSTSKKGPTITFQLQDDADIEYFEAYTVAKGKMAGQIFDMAISISGQDDQAQKQEKPKGGKLSIDAAMLCKNPKFWEWVASHSPYDEMEDWVATEESATKFLKAVCDIDSRSELDHKKGPAHEFKELHRDFSQWVGE